MKIGIISNSKICLPLLGYLSNNLAGVTLYFGKSPLPDISVNELAAFCRVRNVSLYIEQHTNELYQWQQLQGPDIIVVSGYGHKIDVAQLGGVPKGVYNIHFGRLPQYRGPSPVFWQLKNGEAQPGLAIHELTDELDSGAVVWEQKIQSEEHHTYSYLHQIFSELQVKGVLDILGKLSQKQPLVKKVQNQTQANYYNRPKLADVMINWDTMSTDQVINTIKACTSWNNGASTAINGYELKILDAEISLQNVAGAPGTISVTNNKFTVACLDKQALNINFFNINNTCIPARHAGSYGLKTGQKFISKL